MTALSSDQWLAIFMVALFVTVTVIALRRDRSDDQHEPGCYGSQPGPQARAENDCVSCPWARSCLVPSLDALLPPHLRMDRKLAVRTLPERESTK